jgi:hypothetical protein
MTNTVKAGAATVVFLIAILTGYTLGFNQAQAMWENKIKSELLCK